MHRQITRFFRSVLVTVELQYKKMLETAPVCYSQIFKYTRAFDAILQFIPVGLWVRHSLDSSGPQKRCCFFIEVGQQTWYRCSKPKQITLVYFEHSCIALGGSEVFLPVWVCLRQNGRYWCPCRYLNGPHVSQLDLELCITSLWSVLGSFGSSQGIIRWTRWFLPVGGWAGTPRDYLGQGGFS